MGFKQSPEEFQIDSNIQMFPFILKEKLGFIPLTVLFLSLSKTKIFFFFFFGQRQGLACCPGWSVVAIHRHPS